MTHELRLESHILVLTETPINLMLSMVRRYNASAVPKLSLASTAHHIVDSLTAIGLADQSESVALIVGPDHVSQRISVHVFDEHLLWRNCLSDEKQNIWI